MNQKEFSELCENLRKSHEEFNYATNNPFYVVQKKCTDYFKNKDSFDYVVWVDNDCEVEYRDYDPEIFNHLSASDRKDLNDEAFEIHNELFDRIEEKYQRELLKGKLSFQDEIGDLSIRYCRDYWEDISWHITHQSAERFLQNLAVDKYRIFAYSVNQSHEMKTIINLLKENKLILVEEQEIEMDK